MPYRATHDFRRRGYRALRRDGLAADHEVYQLRQGEESQNEGHQIHPDERVHREPAAQRPYDAEQHANERSDDPLDHDATAEHDYHRDADGSRCRDLREAELEHERTRHRNGDDEQHRAEDAAKRRDGVDRPQRIGGLPLACELVAFQERYLRRGARLADEDRGYRVQRVAHAADGGQRDQPYRFVFHVEEYVGERERHDEKGVRARDGAHQRREQHDAYQYDPVGRLQQHRGGCRDRVHTLSRDAPGILRLIIGGQARGAPSPRATQWG